MEPDEMKMVWAEMDRRFADRIRTERVGLRSHVGASSAVRAVQRILYIEIATGVVFALLTGSYLGDNLGAFRFAVPAAALHITAIATIIGAVSQIVALGRTDFAEPVVAIQRRIERLRVIRTRVHRWLLILAPLLWTPLAIIAGHVLFGIDVYEFGAPWLVSNLTFGLVAILLTIALSRRYAGRMREGGVSRSIAELLAGSTVTRAVASVNELVAFEEL